MGGTSGLIVVGGEEDDGALVPVIGISSLSSGRSSAFFFISVWSAAFLGGLLVVGFAGLFTGGLAKGRITPGVGVS